MQIPDFINGGFECLAGFFVLMSCWRTLKDKDIKGVSILTVFFFTLWGFWNLFYYPHLGQWFSFAGGIFIVFANCLWVGLMIYYMRRNNMSILDGKQLEEAEFDGCSGWKYEEECPYNGIFHADSKECRECEKDAQEAMEESINFKG